MIPGPLSYRDFRETGPWPQLFERWTALSTGYITIQRIAQLVFRNTYPLDRAIQLLNNRGLVLLESKDL